MQSHEARLEGYRLEGSTMRRKPFPKDKKPVPILSFRVFDTPQLRDDHYCSLLAYSYTTKCLAVGLGNFVHLWSEKDGVDTPETSNTLSAVQDSGQHVASLAFSSTPGGQTILAVSRANGRIALWSLFDEKPRFDATQPKPISSYILLLCRMAKRKR